MGLLKKLAKEAKIQNALVVLFFSLQNALFQDSNFPRQRENGKN